MPIKSTEDGEVDRLLHHYTAQYPLQTYTLSQSIQADVSKEKIQQSSKKTRKKKTSLEKGEGY